MNIELLLANIRNGSVRFAGITHDSRNVRPGYIFVAILGKNHNGQDYIREAIDKGAACIVSERPCPSPIAGDSIEVCCVKSPRRWLAPLSDAVYGHPSRSMHLIGITGSNGKTTIASMIHSLFAEQGLACGLIGTVENEINGVRSPAKLTTPEATDLQHMLFDMLQAGTRHAVMEVSAQGVEMGRIDETDFSIGIFTNLTTDHLDFHGSMNEYVSAKKRFMNRLKPGKIAIYNLDDPLVKESIRESAAKPFSYSLFDREADLSIQMVEQNASGSRFFVAVSPRLISQETQREPGATGFMELIPFFLPLPGLHNVSNALAALLTGMLSGLEPIVMKQALAKFQPVTRRMEQTVWNDLHVIDDTAMNPGSIQAVLNSFQLNRYNQVTVAFAIRGNRGIDVNRENALVLQEWWRHNRYLSPKLILTSSVDYIEANDKVSPEEEQIVLDTLRQNHVSFTFCPRLADAIEHVNRTAAPGGILFLLGAQGMDEGFRILSQYGKIKDLVKG
jgi:UDP-N-acetylmuramoyl-L-alanyl-D-glutamate--2,6-diaminopimelate ligase